MSDSALVTIHNYRAVDDRRGQDAPACCRRLCRRALGLRRRLRLTQVARVDGAQSSGILADAVRTRRLGVVLFVVPGLVAWRCFLPVAQR